MLFKYYFKIKHISRIDNTRVDILNRKIELQRNKKLLKVMAKLNENKKVKYNHPQLAGTHEVLISL